MAIIEVPTISSSQPLRWPETSGQSLERETNGWLRADNTFLQGLWRRPEIVPVEESCATEKKLHARLLDDPSLSVDRVEIEALGDPDARENYRVVLDFRDRLIAAGTIEACYLTLFRSGQVSVPPVFVDKMATVIVHQVISDRDDAYQARAAELLFREQQATLRDGAVLLGDFKTVEHLGHTAGLGSTGAMLYESGTLPKQVTLDVLSQDNAEEYWKRSGSFDMVLDLTFGRSGIEALCSVLEGWVAHFLNVRVSVIPVREIVDKQWVWHVGLDAEATSLLNDLYNDREVDEDRRARLLSLYRLEFIDPAVMRSDVAGRPVYLGLCMTQSGRMRLKPQNLLVNLPLAADI